MYKVEKVSLFRGLADFLRLPLEVREGRPVLGIQSISVLEFYLMCRGGFWNHHFFIVYHRERAVARLGVEDPRRSGDGTVHFGFFECREGHQEAVKVLLDRVLEAVGPCTLRGPFQFKMEDPCTAVLIKGHDSSPTFLMSHSPPYYGDYLETAGFEGVMDLNSYRLATRGDYSIFRRAEVRAKKSGIAVRQLDLQKRAEDIRALVNLFNESLKDNWGFEEFDEAAYKEFLFFSRIFMDSRCVWLAEYEGELVGGIVFLPNFNEYFEQTGPGLSVSLIRRFLFGPKPRSSRAWAMAIRQDFRSTFLAQYLISRTELASRDAWDWTECSWILAENRPLNRMWQKVAGPPSKVHRVYEISLGAEA